MKLEAAMKEAFSRELNAVPKRQPNEVEIARACALASGSRRAYRRSVVPALAFAFAAVALASLPGAAKTAWGRPLARFLSESIPETAGARLEGFFLLAGESLRSAD